MIPASAGWSTQDPAAGEMLALGQTVTITVGTPAPTTTSSSTTTSTTRASGNNNSNNNGNNN